MAVGSTPPPLKWEFEVSRKAPSRASKVAMVIFVAVACAAVLMMASPSDTEMRSKAKKHAGASQDEPGAVDIDDVFKYVQTLKGSGSGSSASAHSSGSSSGGLPPGITPDILKHLEEAHKAYLNREREANIRHEHQYHKKRIAKKKAKKNFFSGGNW
eukprot:CAMPEP_0175850132 /NCGR_PEP_ID=MMETSP0107_2-20121207/24920_1 /TAXON_ID=195067 ORGANISM="Goniomonas pacifica, Strain CCMP1869" /NCGR_SAMPLE_ID=MMETSP0107_2 /ASSEMBLY_ACC=CAM_ASM_000203 /LENGTH=156 /DNA_ID=CAMNT_0017165387 /DNA_START=15 /DNA_END=485 /DNA_ORIENTATION=-